MATVVKYKIQGQEFAPPREAKDLEIEMSFGENPQPTINFNKLSFVNEANEKIKQWFNSGNAFEGLPFEIVMSDGINTIVPFNGYIDFNDYTIKSVVESELSIVKSKSLDSVNERAKGITMLLLESKGIMPKSDGINIPFIIQNRKTKLEKLQFSLIVFQVTKSIIDEIFKIINIAADITTLGVAQAIINLTTTLASLVILIQKLIDLYQEYMQSYYPDVLIHRGIKLKTFISRGLQYLGYTVDFGIIDSELDNVVLCPTKTDEDGFEIGFVTNSTTTNNISGILKPYNFGYTLSEAFELINKLFNTKSAIINNVLHLKTKKDPFWNTASQYQLPNVNIEQSFINNGTMSYNINELIGRKMIEYAQDDSDKWTITNINDSIAEVVVEPINVQNEENVLIKKFESINIPYALCVRKNENTPLYDKVQSFIDEFNNKIEDINDIIDSVFDVINAVFDFDVPQLPTLNNPLVNSIGAMIVENAFFSTPKIVYLSPDGKIPQDYVNKIGAIALYNNYHSYDSFVPFVRNPNDGNDTNQKKMFKNVKIPFGINNFLEINNNSFFNYNGKIAKFTSVKWNVNADYSIVDFFIYDKYTSNLIENTY